MKPCLICGEPSPGSRCADHQIRKPAGRHAVHLNRTRWKKLSRKLRSMQPWCSACGATNDLTVDHKIPLVERPDLAYDVNNLDVLCRSCNGAKDAHLGGHPKTAGQPPEGKARRRMNVTMDVVI
ncbi:HNH endonuclease [Gordonia iterans]